MDLKKKYRHVLWLGGGTDCGKTTVAAKFAEKHHFQVYHYDRFDVLHHEQLAKTDSAVHRFLEMSHEERWIEQTPESLLARTLRSFDNRFPLVMQDLAEMDSDRPIIAEGFGFLPNLIAPLLSEPNQALFIVPSKKFKTASFNRRGKPSFKNHVSDPQKGWHNLFTRDMLIVEEYQKQLLTEDDRLIEVDAQSQEEMLKIVEDHFEAYLDLIGFELKNKEE